MVDTIFAIVDPKTVSDTHFPILCQTDFWCKGYPHPLFRTKEKAEKYIADKKLNAEVRWIELHD